MSSHDQQPPHTHTPRCLTPLCLIEGVSEEQKEEERSLWASAHLLPDLHMERINKKVLTSQDRVLKPSHQSKWAE